MSQICTTCHKRPPQEGFNTCSECKARKNSARRARYAKDPSKLKANAKISKKIVIDRNRSFIIQYYSQHPCVDCGEADPLVLSFDHVRGQKYKNITQLVANGASINLIKSEIEKCDVRCCNCHSRRTAIQQGWTKYIQSPLEGPSHRFSS